MTNPEFADKNLSCTSCGDGFIFSAGEQELFQLRGITSHPDRCPTCSRGGMAAAARRITPEPSSA